LVSCRLLKGAEITPQFLPVQVRTSAQQEIAPNVLNSICQVFVTVQCKDGLRFPLVIKPTENAKDVREQLKQFCDKNGDPVIKFSKKSFFSIRKPYAAKLEGADSAAAAAAPSKKKKQVEKEETVIEDEDIPIRQYNPEPGSLLVLNGRIQFKRYYQDLLRCLTGN